jgi:hypothetical protein
LPVSASPGTVRIAVDIAPRQELSLNGNSVFSLVSHEWGSPQATVSICLLKRHSKMPPDITVPRFTSLPTGPAIRLDWIGRRSMLPTDSGIPTMPKRNFAQNLQSSSSRPRGIPQRPGSARGICWVVDQNSPSRQERNIPRGSLCFRGDGLPLDTGARPFASRRISCRRSHA